jgi:hypothetical protein
MEANLRGGTTTEEGCLTDDLLRSIASLGWFLNNCHQLDDGTFRVNLRRPDGSGDWFTDWSYGPTFAEALEDCFDKMLTAEFEAERETSSSIDTTKPLGLLEQLGLKQKFERRI